MWLDEFAWVVKRECVKAVVSSVWKVWVEMAWMVVRSGTSVVLAIAAGRKVGVKKVLKKLSFNSL